MSLLDPKERSARGAKAQAELTAAPVPEPATLYDSAWRDFVFAEVWTRPGLDLRSRYLIALSSAACAHDLAASRAYARGALATGELDLTELREAALHLAVYGGFSEGGVMDRAITIAAEDRGISDTPCEPLRAAPWDPAQRHADGAAGFERAMLFSGPPPRTAYFEGGILNFVFGEVWSRPGLDQRARRWVTLVGVANSSSATPIRSHTWSAMASGNASAEEMLEFVLQYAVHSGWPRASVMQGVVMEMAEKVRKGLAYDA